MGKSEVIKALKKKPFVTSKELEEFIGINVISVNRIIRSLMKDVTENLCCRELSDEEKYERYGRNINTSVRIFWLGN